MEILNTQVNNSHLTKKHFALQLYIQKDEYAQELDKRRTSLIEKAIELYFDKLDEMVADKRIDNLKVGKTKVIPLTEVFAKAGISVELSF